MRLDFLFLGKTKEGFIQAGEDFYYKRLRPLVDVSEHILKGASLPPNASPKDEQLAKEKEAALVLAKIRTQDFLIVLDVAGQQMSSEDLARQIEKQKLAGHSNLKFAVGGPWGLGPALIQRANLRLSLSPMTFTHELARLILLEQVYRAFSILAGSPYHK